MNWLFNRFRTEPTEYVAPVGDRIETSSETWGFVSQWAEKEISRLRESNDSTMLDELKTNEIRGGIKAMKRLLDLAKPKKVREKRDFEDEY